MIIVFCLEFKGKVNIFECFSFKILYLIRYSNILNKNRTCKMILYFGLDRELFFIGLFKSLLLLSFLNTLFGFFVGWK